MEKESFILKMGHTIKELLIMEVHRDKVDIFIIMDVFMKVRLKIMRLQGLVHITMLFRVIIMKETGFSIFHQVSVNKSFLMVHTMKVILKMELKMAKEGTFQTPVFTKEILRMENLMAKEALLM